MRQYFGNDWDELLREEMEKPYYLELRRLLVEEYRHFEIYPPMEEVFYALRTTSYEDTRVLLLGQDPYHGPGQAHGMSFSVRPGVPLPPSLRNIYKELETDLGISPARHGYLKSWAEQGVLLLNTTLTVRRGQAASHEAIGWRIFTDKIIALLNEKPGPLVFLLWGAHARSKKRLLTNPEHLILEAPHPSPLSAHRGFFGSRPFSAINEYLTMKGEAPISWALPEQP